jgi:hypothetical protein
MNLDGRARNRRGMLLVVLAALAAPVTAAETAPAAAERCKPLDLRLVAGRLEGGTRTVRYTRGDRIVMRWVSDRNLTLHLHGYDVALPLSPAVEATLVVEARIVGRFPLTAHFPAPAAGAAEHPRERTLLYVEVRPE